MHIEMLHLITRLGHVPGLWCKDGPHLHSVGEDAKAQRGWILLAKLPSWWGDRHYESRGWAINTLYYFSSPVVFWWFSWTHIPRRKIPGSKGLLYFKAHDKNCQIIFQKWCVLPPAESMRVYFTGVNPEEPKSLEPWYGTSNLSLCLPSCVMNIGCS